MNNELTQKEKQVLKIITDLLNGDYSCVDTYTIFNEAEDLSEKQVEGVVSSLLKKNEISEIEPHCFAI